MAKRYGLLGINDDETTCAVCGRVELKRVMWVQELDADGNPTGEPFHCGTTCGAKLLGRGYTASVMNRILVNFEANKRRALRKMMEEHPLKAQIITLLNNGQTEQAQKLTQELKQWASSQTVIVAI